VQRDAQGVLTSSPADDEDFHWRSF
jgi:hypothetical protein